ncbi:MAG: helix-turn-helix transcriptional regulator [Gammaproteobacteria bacterium]|nr:helix-turn-helix transcriptional regulator [Gammaproteobacteria bacterium]
MKTIYKKRYRQIILSLVAKRKQSALTQQQLADKLEKPQSYIAKIEKYERKLDVMEFIEFCEALDIDTADMVDILRRSKC